MENFSLLGLAPAQARGKGQALCTLRPLRWLVRLAFARNRLRGSLASIPDQAGSPMQPPAPGADNGPRWTAGRAR